MRRLIEQLEDAAGRVDDLPRHEIAALLRRVALRLRNIPPGEADLADEYQHILREIDGEHA